MGEQVDSNRPSHQEDVDSMHDYLMGMMPSDAVLMFGHRRLDEPLREVLMALAVRGVLSGPDGGLGALAEEAKKQALAASAARASLPPGGPSDALGLVMQAWVSLEETCLFGGDE